MTDAASRPLTIRTVHHFACTGGTLLAKCIAALPRTVLLSEVDPLTFMIDPHPKTFAPTDLIAQLRRRYPDVPEKTLAQMFLGAVGPLAAELVSRNTALVLRDHSHSAFCTAADPAARPTLLEMLKLQFAVKPVLTVRHPLDSFLSLNANGWKSFTPFTLEEYSLRYIKFLERHTSVPIIKFEDFVADSQGSLAGICKILDLTFDDRAIERSSTIKLSGDSGRKQAVPGARTRREIPSHVAAQMENNAVFWLLCQRLDYPMP